MKLNKTIYLNAGHSNIDPGSISKYAIESEINKSIRNKVYYSLLLCGFKVEKVPDNLNLTQSIAWTRKRATNINDGLALSIHCNCCGGDGAETYYYGNNKTSKDIATKLLKGYCQETGFKKSNGGVRSDRTSGVGSLGWIRKTKTWAVLLEMGYIDNKKNIDFIVDNENLISKGIVHGIFNVYGLYYGKSEEDMKYIELQKIKKLAKQIIDLT